MKLKEAEEQNEKGRQDVCYFHQDFFAMVFFFLIKARISPDLLTCTSPRNRAVKEETSVTSMQVAPGSKGLQDLSVSQLNPLRSHRAQGPLGSSDGLKGKNSQPLSLESFQSKAGMGILDK